MTAEFAVNNKVHATTKVLPFMANYKRERIDIKRKGKVKKAIEFVERMKRVQKEVEVALKKVQDDMKRQADKERRKVENWKRGNKVMLSTKNLVFKERLVKKLMEKYRTV